MSSGAASSSITGFRDPDSRGTHERQLHQFEEELHQRQTRGAADLERL